MRPLHVLPDRARAGAAEPHEAAGDAEIDRSALDALVAAHPEALATPRQRARFLCGLTSPATTRAKLTRHPLFGALAEQRFADVLELRT